MFAPLSPRIPHASIIKLPVPRQSYYAHNAAHVYFEWLVGRPLFAHLVIDSSLDIIDEVETYFF